MSALCMINWTSPLFISIVSYLHSLQEDLDCLFPNWRSIRRHENVIIFAFGLSDQPQPLIQLLYERLTCHLKEGNDFGDTENFLMWLQREIKQDTGLDFIHDQYFNYTTMNDPRLFLRSTFYLFDNQTPDSRAIVKLNEGSTSQSSTPAECTIKVEFPSFFLNSLKILQDIQSEHKIMVSALCLMWPESHLEPHQILSKTEKDDTAVLMKSTLKLHRDLKVFDITGCHVTQPSFKHLAKQLCHCQEISTLHLRDVQDYIPILLGKAIASSPSLRTVSLEYSWMTSATAEAVLFGLSQCRGLETLHLSECKLTNCLVHFFNNPNHTGFPSLKTLGLRRAHLSKSDFLVISGAMIQNKLPQLAKLFIAENEQLGGCLQCFLSAQDSKPQVSCVPTPRELRPHWHKPKSEGCRSPWTNASVEETAKSQNP